LLLTVLEPPNDDDGKKRPEKEEARKSGEKASDKQIEKNDQ